jgi:imidazole glycerol-phosphate synthase subunit HisH
VIEVALLDYGTGNLHSLGKALEAGGARVRVESELAAALDADALVLPGVGSFPAAAARLADGRAALRGALDSGLPCLGICLGMQLLFDGSEEGVGSGIGVFGGTVRRLRAPRVPHMGWNAVVHQEDILFEQTPEPLVYYANSYVAAPESDAEVIAWTEYGDTKFPAAVRCGVTWGVQFHPEKSGRDGLRMLANFLRASKR